MPADDTETLVSLADRLAAQPALAVKDEMCTALSADGFVSAKAVVSSTLVRELATRQNCLPLAAAALGRAVICTLLMAEGLKQEETFQVRFQGDGPLNGVLAVANGRLEARGFVGNSRVTLPLNAKGKLDVGGGVGKGNLFVVRAKKLPGDVGVSPYSSITQIRSGEIPEDINYFLSESEQREGALAAGVHVNANREVDAAAGWTVHLLPGASDEVAAQLMANLEAMAESSPTSMALEGLAPQDVLNKIMAGMEPQFFAPRVPVMTPGCCSEAQVYRTLSLLPLREVVQIVELNEKVTGLLYGVRVRMQRAALETA
jgi:molecular chaperone Hsp33